MHVSSVYHGKFLLDLSIKPGTTKENLKTQFLSRKTRKPVIDVVIVTHPADEDVSENMDVIKNIISVARTNGISVITDIIILFWYHASPFTISYAFVCFVF